MSWRQKVRWNRWNYYTWHVHFIQQFYDPLVYKFAHNANSITHSVRLKRKLEHGI